jgi:glycosyltransferase involved in cell wall biosynthesis
MHLSLLEAQRMNVGIVSTHPSFSGGVSSYTRNLINSFENSEINITLYANCLEKQGVEKNVIPCWNEGILYPFQIFKTLLREKLDLIHIQHEFFLFGGLVSALLFPILLILCKLLRKPTIVTLHGIIPLSTIDKHFIKENALSGSPYFLRFGIKLLTMFILVLSDAIIVHEHLFATLLQQNYHCSPNKLHIIPHGVEQKKSKITKTEAKKTLQLFNKVVIFFFGYLAPYKGLKTLVDGFKLKVSTHPDWLLIIGGGKHPRLKHNISYQRYLTNLKREASSLPSNILFTGFLPDEKIPLFYSAADIIVFPYTFTMSSSGPFAKALTYEKPILVSNTPLFEEIIPFKEVIFNQDSPSNFGDKLERLLEDSLLQNRMIDWAKNVASNHSWKNVGISTASIYTQLLHNSKISHHTL